MSWWEGVDETRLLVAPEPSATGKYVGQYLSLRHPKSDNCTCFLLINGALHEIHWFKQSYVSWFVGDYVCEDGRLYTVTPVDPVFILLPIFEEARMKKGDDPGKFRQLDEMIFIDGYPGYQYLLSIVETSMQVVCDIQEVGSSKFFRLNDSKVLAWLNCKECLFAPNPSDTHLARMEAEIFQFFTNNSGDVSKYMYMSWMPKHEAFLSFKVNQLKRTLPSLDKYYAARDEKDALADAVSVLGEYLKDEPWLKLLCSNLKLDLEAATKTSDIEMLQTIVEDSPVSFKPVQEKSGSDKKTTRSGRQTKKAKVGVDSRNISDMFSRVSRRK